MSRLALIPMSLTEAHAFVRQYHRHHRPSVSGLFALGASQDEKVVGVAVVGRPVARLLQDGWTVEVTRLCTDGTHNACSFLYGAARRVAAVLGYKRIVTYTLPAEGGASLRASGWTCAGLTGKADRSWSCPSRPRVDRHPLQAKLRWEVAL